MSYQALYRAWRPQTFQDLIGQPHVKQTLENAIARGRLAHAYLFCGPRGTGKTSAAKVLAKAVNCLAPVGSEPCNECEVCRSITNGSNVDVEEIDAASNRGVDEIRQLRDKVQYAPTSVTRKVYIVDEVHMLTTEAFNALLKTLEEPPAHTLFVLATTEPHKIPPTIISRCQRFDFRRIAPEIIVEHLKRICGDKDWAYEEEALWRVADAADGGLRDALGLLEQTASFAKGTITAEDAAHVMGGVQTGELLGLVEALQQRDAGQVLQLLLGWYEGGKDAARILHEVLQLLRDLFIVKLSHSGVPVRFKGEPEAVAKQLDETWLLHAMQKLGEAYVQLRYVEQPRLALETSLLGLISVAPQQVPAAPVAESVAGSPQGEVSRSGAEAPHAPNEQGTQGTSPAQGRTLSPQRDAHPASEHTRPASGDTEASPSATTGRKRSGSNPLSAQKRKQEVLRQLYEASNEEQRLALMSQWEDLLQAVRSESITTHAWLMNGSPVLVTEDTAVVAFSSRLHRDAVMKRNERALIEQALSGAFERPMQVLALLTADWEQFTADLEKESATDTADEQTSDESADLVDKVTQLFGKERVEVIHQE